MEITISYRHLIRNGSIKEGTILVTRRDPASDIFMDKMLKFTHLGICAMENGELRVFDLHPDNVNSKGRNLERQPIEKYMKGRRLIGIYQTGASTSRIQAIAARFWDKKYDAYTFNCQKFIDEVTYGKFNSDLWSYYAGKIIPIAAVGLAIGIGAVYLISQAIKKKKQ